LSPPADPAILKVRDDAKSLDIGVRDGSDLHNLR
jgi:hypothetical protein